MRAVVQTKQGLAVQDVAKPTPADHELLIKVHAASVTRGDVIMKNIPRIAFPLLSFVGARYKPTPGTEFAGMVEAVGQNVTRFQVGDAVFGTTTGLRAGGNAEYVCLPESWRMGVIAPKPDTLPFEQAAALPVGAMTALYLLKQADIQPGDNVLVYGASGSVGSYAVQLAKHFGATVTGVCSTRNMALVTSFGADHVIDYKAEDFSRRGDTYTVIFDAVGKTTRQQRKQALADGGRVVTVRSITHENADELAYLGELAAAGAVKPVIDRCYTLEQVSEAYELVNSGRKAGNIIINIVDTPCQSGLGGLGQSRSKKLL